MPKPGSTGSIADLSSIVSPTTKAALCLASAPGATYKRVALALGWTPEQTLRELRQGLAEIRRATDGQL